MGDHAFVSYARSDQAYVDKLVAHLRAHGVDAWTDAAIYSGEEWPDVIRQKIDSCATFVVVISPAAQRSRWVRREILHAQTQRKKIFPLLLSGKVLFELNDLQHEDVEGGSMPSARWVGHLRAVTRSPAAGQASMEPTAPGWVPETGSAVSGQASAHAPDTPPPLPEDRPPRRYKRLLRTAAAGLVAVLVAIAAVLFIPIWSAPGQDGAATDSTQTNSPMPTALSKGTEQPTSNPGTVPGETPSPTTEPPMPPAAPTPSPVFEPVVILNKSTIRGQAEAAVERVEAAGFRVDRVGNFLSTYNVPVSTVFYDAGHEPAARTMLDRIPGVERIVLKSEAGIQSTDPLILVVNNHFPTDLTES